MRSLILVLTLLSADLAWGYSLKLSEFNVEYYQYEGRRDAYYPDYPTQGRWKALSFELLTVSEKLVFALSLASNDQNVSL